MKVERQKYARIDIQSGTFYHILPITLNNYSNTAHNIVVHLCQSTDQGYVQHRC